MTKTSKSPAENAKKATKPLVKPTPKNPAKPGLAAAKKAAPSKASAWRTATPPALPTPATPAKEVAPAPVPAAPAPIAQKPLTAFQRWAQKDGAFEELIAFILDGGHMADFCKAREIPYTTMYDWVRKDDSRSEMYARAREDRADKLADEIVSIADEADYAPVVDMATGQTVAMAFDKTAVARNKLRVDARKWIAAKMKPRIYGEKVQVEGTIDHKSVSDDELLKRLAKFGVVVPAIVPQGGQDAG